MFLSAVCVCVCVCVCGDVCKCTPCTLCIIVHIIVIRSVRRGLVVDLRLSIYFAKTNVKGYKSLFIRYMVYLDSVLVSLNRLPKDTIHPPHWIKLFLPEWNYKEWMNSNQSRMHCVGLTINPNKIYRITPFIVFCFHPMFSLWLLSFV